MNQERPPHTGTDPRPGLVPETAERVRASIARQTLLTTLGVTVETLEVGYVELALPSRPDLMQQHGFMHAGAITTIADSACGYAAYTLFPKDRDVLTVDFSMNMVAPAAQPAFQAVGHVIRAGRTITTCRGEVYGVSSDGERTIVALIQSTLMAVSRLSDANPPVETPGDTSAGYGRGDAF